MSFTQSSLLSLLLGNTETESNYAKKATEFKTLAAQCLFMATICERLATTNDGGSKSSQSSHSSQSSQAKDAGDLLAEFFAGAFTDDSDDYEDEKTEPAKMDFVVKCDDGEMRLDYNFSKDGKNSLTLKGLLTYDVTFFLKLMIPSFDLGSTKSSVPSTLSKYYRFFGNSNVSRDGKLSTSFTRLQSYFANIYPNTIYLLKHGVVKDADALESEVSTFSPESAQLVKLINQWIPVSQFTAKLKEKYPEVCGGLLL